MRRALFLAAGIVTLAASPITTNGPYVNYPNIPGEVLLENDRVVVQKFVIQPGQWEGIHSHPGNQVYVHIKGGQWTVRRSGKETTSVSPDGSVGWMEPIDISENHESGNTGKTPIELVWITLK